MQIGNQSYPFTNNLDEYSNSVKTIDIAHHEVHEGDSFMTTFHEDKSINTNVDILISVGSTYPHLTYTVENESEADIALYENTTVSNAGVVLAVVNRNRMSTNNAKVNVYTSPTMTNVGTQVAVWHSGSGKGTAGGSRDENELILKNNVNYLLRISATAAGWVAVRNEWYELVAL